MADNRQKLLSSLESILEDYKNPELDSDAYYDLKDSGTIKQIKIAVDVLRWSIRNETVDQFTSRLGSYYTLFRKEADKDKIANFIISITSDDFSPPVLGGSEEGRSQIITNDLNGLRVLKGILGVTIGAGLFIGAAWGASIALAVAGLVYAACFAYKSRHVLSNIPALGHIIRPLDRLLKKHRPVNRAMHFITTFFVGTIPTVAASALIITRIFKDDNERFHFSPFREFIRFKACEATVNLCTRGVCISALCALPNIAGQTVSEVQGLPVSKSKAVSLPYPINNEKMHNKVMKSVMYDLNNICLIMPYSDQQRYDILQSLQSKLISLIDYRREIMRGISPIAAGRAKNKLYVKKTEMLNNILQQINLLIAGYSLDETLDELSNKIRVSVGEYREFRDSTLRIQEPDKLFTKTTRFPSLELGR